MIRGLARGATPTRWSPLLLVTLLYVGLTALATYSLHYAIHARPAIEVILSVAADPWPFEPLRRGIGWVSTLLCVALWISWRRRSVEEGWPAALGLLLAALLLLALQWMVNRGLAAPELSGELIRIQ